MEKSTKRLKNIEEHAPKSKDVDPKTTQTITCCLSWHLLGQCFTNCRRAQTHRKLESEEYAGMCQLVETHLQT
jgi:hypothetical protein